MGNRSNKASLPDELSSKDISRLKGITKLSEAEIQEWYKGFTHDCHPNKNLTKDRFKEIHGKYYPQDKANIFCEYIFKAYGSGNEMDFNQFIIAVSPRSQVNLDDRLGVMFDMYDMSHDKRLDQMELSALITAMYDLVDESDRKDNKHPNKRAARIIKHAHINRGKNFRNPQTINKQQFIDGCKRDRIISKLLDCNFKDT